MVWEIEYMEETMNLKLRILQILCKADDEQLKCIYEFVKSFIQSAG